MGYRLQIGLFACGRKSATGRVLGIPTCYSSNIFWDVHAFSSGHILSCTEKRVIFLICVCFQLVIFPLFKNTTSSPQIVLYNTVGLGIFKDTFEVWGSSSVSFLCESVRPELWPIWAGIAPPGAFPSL